MESLKLGDYREELIKNITDFINSLPDDTTGNIELSRSMIEGPTDERGFVQYSPGRVDISGHFYPGSGQ